MTGERVLDLHEYAEDVALDVVRKEFGSDSIGRLNAYERALAHAVADAVADLAAS